jgi:predicted transcriptional regulator YheO
MQKKHKVAVVRDLKNRGMFHLRDAVDMVAASLGVTRFTIYNYLNEIGDGESQDDDAEQTATSKE